MQKVAGDPGVDCAYGTQTPPPSKACPPMRHLNDHATRPTAQQGPRPLAYILQRIARTSSSSDSDDSDNK
jgi:hypothetical protein